MLRTSTRNVAYEVISCLIDAQGWGVLTEIIKYLTTSNKHIVEDGGSSILDNLSRKTSQYGKHHNKTHKHHPITRIDDDEDTESYVNHNFQ